jgi:bifunctional non-homologous end joining protein LigD
VIANDLAALLYVTNLGCIDHNPWSSRRDDLEHPDYFFFDLDPSEGTDFSTVIVVAQAIQGQLKKLGVKVFLKTSGATGFHLYVPVKRDYTYDQLRMFAEIVARVVADSHPNWVTQERSVAKRPPKRIYIDVSQNALGRPLATVYVVRPFPKAPISTPVQPRELRAGLKPEKFNIKSIFPRLEKTGDLWSDFSKSPQSLENAIQKLSVRPPG